MLSKRLANLVHRSQLFFCSDLSFLVSPETVAAFRVSIQYCANFCAPRSSFVFAYAGISGPEDFEDALASSPPPQAASERQHAADTRSRRRRRITYSILTCGR